MSLLSDVTQQAMPPAPKTIPCRICSEPISKKAHNCPKCGEPYRMTRTDQVATIAFWIMVISFAGWILQVVMRSAG